MTQPFDFTTGPQDAVTVLVFYRGHWCPYCRRYLAKLAERWADFVQRKVRLAAVSVEPPATSAALARDLSLPFPLLSDTGGQVVGQFGVRNTHVSGLLSHPAVVVIDRQGQIRFRSIDRDFKRRTTIRTILSEIDRAVSA